MNCPTEHSEQVTFCNEMRRQFPDLKFFAIPNGGLRHKVTAQKLKMEGASPGVPDIYIPGLRLWIEMKRRKGGRLSPDQKKWLEYLERIGDKTVVAKGWEEAINAVREANKSRG